jgi:hypothetical protein
MTKPGFILAAAGSFVLAALAAWTALGSRRASYKIKAIDKDWRPVTVQA